MSESKVCFRWKHGQKITANDLVLALNEAYGLVMDTDNIFSCYQYKVIVSNRTVYKEFEIAAGVENVKLGTTSSIRKPKQ